MKHVVVCILLVLITSLLFGSCYYDNREELYPSLSCDTSAVKYSVHIAPVLKSSCLQSGCHNGPAPSSGISLTTHAEVKVMADNGRLLGSINHNSGYSPMPAADIKLDDCLIAQFARWISEGSPNN